MNFRLNKRFLEKLVDEPTAARIDKKNLVLVTVDGLKNKSSVASFQNEYASSIVGHDGTTDKAVYLLEYVGTDEKGNNEYYDSDETYSDFGIAKKWQKIREKILAEVDNLNFDKMTILAEIEQEKKKLKLLEKDYQQKAEEFDTAAIAMKDLGEKVARLGFFSRLKIAKKIIVRDFANI